jgi:hypothetical protein
MNLIILLGAMLALAWLSTRSRVPATVPLHSGRTRQRRR